MCQLASTSFDASREERRNGCSGETTSAKRTIRTVAHLGRKRRIPFGHAIALAEGVIQVALAQKLQAILLIALRPHVHREPSQVDARPKDNAVAPEYSKTVVLEVG